MAMFQKSFQMLQCRELTAAHQDLCQASLAGVEQRLPCDIGGVLWLMLKLLGFLYQSNSP